MTLAVILGLWFALAGSTPSGSTHSRPQSGDFRALAQETTPPESPKPPEPQPAAPAQEPAPQQPQAGSPPAPPDSASQNAEPAEQPAPTKTKKHSHKKKSRSADPPAKVVIRNGGTADPTVNLSPGLSKGQAANQLQNANQLLNATESNLKQLSERTLSLPQQDTIKQIRSYMDQARKAVDAGDLERGHNLAFKAHLLSDDLVKH
jgi:type IV secretory pathway VirB10-like protein